MEELKNCPLCHSDEIRMAHTIKDFSTSQETFQVSVCTNCSLLFTNPRPRAEAIGRYYDNPNYISHTNSRRGVFSILYQSIRARAIQTKLGWLKQQLGTERGALLDYGSGTGEFLNKARTAGWHTTGIELADEPRKMSIENYGLTIYSPVELNEIAPCSQDAITMWHVLEHLPDLQKSLQSILEKLRAGGLLVVAVPNYESPDAKHYKEYWAAWDVPIHYFHFSKKSMEVFAERNGLELIDVKPMPFDAYYVALLSEEFAFGRKRWISAFVNGTLSNMRAGKHNTSSLTYIFKKVQT